MRPLARRGVTLIETVTGVAIIAISVAAVAPVLHGSIDLHARSQAVRREAASVSFAIDRITRLVREAPIDEDGVIGIEAPSSDSITLEDGRGARFFNGAIMLRDREGGEAPLAGGIESISFSLLDAAGDPVREDGSQPHSVHVVIATGGMNYGAVIWIRCSPGEA